MRGSRTKALKGQRPVSGKALLAVASWIILQSMLVGTQHWRKNKSATLTYGELLEKIEAGKVAKIELDKPNNRQLRFN